MGEEEVYKAVYTADAEKLVSESRKAAKSQEGLEKALDDTAVQARKTSQRLAGYAKTLGAVGAKVARFGVVATAATAGIIAQSLRAASSVEEMSSRFQITFKQMSENVKAWAIDYSARIGRSRFELMAMVSDMKVLLTAFGLEEQAAIGAAKALVKKTQDISSFRDMHAEEIFNKIAAALSGEAEGLARIGIFTKEAQIKQLALNEGFTEGTEALTDLVKVKLRLKLIMRGLIEANGDAERTVLSLTNQWRALWGALQELNVELGRVFVDSAKGGIKALADLVRDSARWIEMNRELVRTMGASILKVGLFAIALGKLIHLGTGLFKLHTILAAVGPTLAVVGGALTAALGTAALAAGAGVGYLVGRFTGLHEALGHLLKGLFTLNKDAIKLGEEAEKQAVKLHAAALARAETRRAVQKQLVQVFKETWETASAAAKSYGADVDALNTKMQNLLNYHAELTEAQASFAQAAEDAMFELAKKTMPEAEVALADYARLVQEIEALWPEIVTGSTEAILEMEKLISQVPSLNLEQLAQAWGVSVEAAQAKLSELVASTQKDVEGIADLHKKVTEDVIKTTTKRLESLEKRVEDIAESMKDLQMDVDVEGALKSLDSVLAKVGEVQERALAATGIAAGPGLGSPGLDHLSTAKVSPRVGRSGGNVVNVSATIPITRAEPVTAMAKAVASEIGRMRRRGQVKW